MDKYNIKFNVKEYNKIIGKMLKSVRIEEGLSQKEMAGGIVSNSFYSKVENGVHGINVSDIIKILAAHNLDVVTFFDNLDSAVVTMRPFKNLELEIAMAQNQKDIDTLKKIETKVDILKSGGVVLPDAIDVQLEMAQRFALGSMENVSPLIVQKAKKIIKRNNKSFLRINYLAQIIGLFNDKEAVQYVNDTLDELSNENKNLEPVAGTLVVNYLYCSYLKGADKETMINVINKYLATITHNISLGVYPIIIKCYKAILEGDQDLEDKYLWMLKDLGYYDVIKDIVEK